MATSKPKPTKKAAKAKKAPAKKAAAKKASPPKKAPAKKVATKKANSKKASAKKLPAKKAAAKKAPVKKVSAKKEVAKKAPAKKAAKKVAVVEEPPMVVKPKKELPKTPLKLSPFLKRQKQRLLDLRDSLVDAMDGVARDSLRGGGGADSSAFGMHQADAGTDSYDRDFALNLLSQEHDALFEIEEALYRIEVGEYGICEMSGKQIMEARLEAIPFARLTVECQAQVEKDQAYGGQRQSVHSLFGLDDESPKDKSGK